MKIFELLRNPLIKTVGIVLILYFALFANKHNPDSLGNRLSPEQIKQSIGEVKDKAQFISANVKIAQEIAKEKEEAQKAEAKNAAKIKINDVAIGDGEMSLACGDIAEISYVLYGRENAQLEFIDSKKLVIGGKENALVENKIIGMKRGGIREISVPHDFKTDDKKLLNLLRLNNSDLKYHITLLEITKIAGANLSCQ